MKKENHKVDITFRFISKFCILIHIFMLKPFHDQSLDFFYSIPSTSRDLSSGLYRLPSRVGFAANEALDRAVRIQPQGK